MKTPHDIIRRPVLTEKGYLGIAEKKYVFEVDVTATCRPSNFGVAGRSETGMHRAVVPVIDALDNVGGVELFVDVQAAPA